jgi:hypothetical protein
MQKSLMRLTQWPIVLVLWFGMNPYKRRHDSQHNEAQNNDIQRIAE